MRHRVAKLLATLACSLTIWLGCALPTNAGVMPYLWAGTFAPVSQDYVSYYAPSTGYVGPYVSYYGGSTGCGVGCSTGCNIGCGVPMYVSRAPRAGLFRLFRRNCGLTGACYGSQPYGLASACDPCGGSCSSGCFSDCGGGCASGSCGVGGNCAGGNCNINSQFGGALTPVPDNSTPPQSNPAGQYEAPRSTYADDPAAGGPAPVAPGATGTNSTGPAPSGTPGAFRPTERLPRGTVPAPGFKPTDPNASPANPTDGAGAFESPVESNTPAPKKSVAPPKIPDDKDASNGPALNLDDKVAWRPVSERTRLEPKLTYTHARLLRVPAYPQSDWVPVPSESKLARK